ncbi:hypothetical protein C8R43DRAFT_1238937 [Mycena crocata]|nr:hypothetical protein C8R43DRAFT_1238937 [Mycena crocata]
MASKSFPTSTALPSVDISPPTSLPPKPRSRRCFVCGGTGKHKLSPQFCPRTWDLCRQKLAKFNPDGRLVSYDGSPLPMTRNRGGVAAHLLSRRRQLPPHLIPATRGIDITDRGSIPSPPHLVGARVPHQPIARSVPPSLSTPLPRPTVVPQSIPQPVSKPPRPLRLPRRDFILPLFDTLVLSASFRQQVKSVIAPIEHMDTGDLLGLWKRVEPIRDRLKSVAVHL